jgi:hypothetical protein
MEAVFQPESLRIFSINFWLASSSVRQETPVNHRKKSENFPVGILLPFLIIFRTFSAGSSDFPVCSSETPVISRGRNHRLGYYNEDGVRISIMLRHDNKQLMVYFEVIYILLKHFLIHFFRPLVRKLLITIEPI